jgi:short-subunit dehydrogenase
MEVNFFATAELMRLCTPHLTRSGDTATAGWVPAIVNVASVCGRWGIPSLSEHCASKHAIVGLSESLRAEYARYGIEVLVVLPGIVETDDVRKHLLRNEPKIHLDTENATPADEVARGVVQTLVKSRKEKPVGPLAWWICFGKRMFPRLVRFIMLRKVRNFAKREQRQPETSNR